MIILSPYEAKVAYSMIRAAKKIKPTQPDYDPIEKYSYLWIAFNNIYQTITDYKGKSAKLRRLSDGSIETKIEGKLQIPKVDTPSEREQIDFTVEEFGKPLKEQLIRHDSTKFFVYRTPQWQGIPIQKDIRGQELNGVLNVARTISKENPVWSPVDKEIYERYISSKQVTEDEIAQLVREVVNVLYTVRNNLFHGGKRMDDSNDVEVVKRAVPLLLLIVSAFTR